MRSLPGALNHEGHENGRRARKPFAALAAFVIQAAATEPWQCLIASLEIRKSTADERWCTLIICGYLRKSASLLRHLRSGKIYRSISTRMSLRLSESHTQVPGTTRVPGT